MEYCEKGSLYHLLRKEKMTWDKFFSFALQMLKGISALHNSTPQVLHRDVKTLNFLVNKNYVIKVADFGLSRFNTRSNQVTLNKTRGTSVYCAPEVFEGKEYSQKSDLYSLGTVFWEMVYTVINQRYLHPYAEYKKLNEFQIMLSTANNDLRPTLPPTTPTSIRALIQSCWEKDLSKRPIASEAFDTLEIIQKEYQSNQAAWDEIINHRDTNSTSDQSSESSSFSN
ncbi:hypothetical protein DICPUDRAFT_91861 [Dictyostelium purpureum]|uniref:Protein kinase domain-containing protein n=1 Tax=Dictyostelium purpureum TaxID=5786 RepID=F0ZID9_DICPU|nr:uncharacterized protein DICPUDRAFT_91861 [Dictyostelium purpureum]EGC36308.1 hypothetical protein DICPUDRAFT_91861 [Dictyostelium purpureum]|eukprot:XP_003287186.1 hypothetical protein DICPUDRAFT_91861 [Dictyostelium purpureum]